MWNVVKLVLACLAVLVLLVHALCPLGEPASSWMLVAAGCLMMISIAIPDTWRRLKRERLFDIGAAAVSLTCIAYGIARLMGSIPTGT